MATANCDSYTSERLGRRSPRRPWRALIWVWLLPALWCGAQAGDYPLEVIELRARFPEDLIPTLRPLAGPDGTLVGANHSLFVRAAPARLADIRRALAVLDQPARNLLIQVRQSGSSASQGSAAGARIDQRVGGDGNGRVRIGPPGPAGSAVGAWAGQRSQQRDLTQEVRALDGQRAFIAIGEELPLPYRELAVGSGGAVVREGRAYRRAESGFYVVPRVLGDQVTLDISTRDTARGTRGTLETSAMQGRVQGRLGDWIPLGLSNTAQSSQGGGLLAYGTTRGDAEQRIELRVLPLD